MSISGQPFAWAEACIPTKYLGLIVTKNELGMKGAVYDRVLVPIAWTMSVLIGWGIDEGECAFVSIVIAIYYQYNG